jgi:hypothetical protein
MKNLPDLTGFAIDRSFIPPDFGEIINLQLHIFGDASEQGIGIAAYVRVKNNAGNISTNLAMAKSRVAPLKTVTVPRLELQAAAMAAHLKWFLEQELTLKLDLTVLWTDSTTMLRYLRNEERRFRIFVANRISQIRAVTEVDQWRHVPTNQNPADIASRGCLVAELVDNKLWKQGPNFLREDEDMWPKNPIDLEHLIDDPELKTEKATICAVDIKCNPVDRILACSSNWLKIRKHVA